MYPRAAALCANGVTHVRDLSYGVRVNKMGNFSSVFGRYMSARSVTPSLIFVATLYSTVNSYDFSVCAVTAEPKSKTTAAAFTNRRTAIRDSTRKVHLFFAQIIAALSSPVNFLLSEARSIKCRILLSIC